MSNQKRVWEEEKKALDERKRIDQMKKERAEERQIQELQQMQEAAGGKKQVDRVNWMYSGPSSGQAGTTEEMEGYLLGKRRVDGLIKGMEHKKLEKASTEESFMALQNANTVRDTASKIRDDPMLAIKRQEQAAYETMMNDPARRRQLLKAASSGDVRKAKTKDKDSRHRRHHHRDEESHRHHSHKRRRRDDGDDRYGRDGHERRRRSDSFSSCSRSTSPHRRGSSPGRYSSRHDRPRRSLSPRESRRPSNHRRRSSPPSRRRPRSRSVTPERYRSHHRVRSISPRRGGSPSARGSGHRHHGNGYSNGHQREQNGYGSTTNGIQQDETDEANSRAVDVGAERAKKLAAMQADASELDADRDRRLAAIAERERMEREAEDAARLKSSKYGGKGDFVMGLNRKAGDLDLAERVRRGRGGMEREREEF